MANPARLQNDVAEAIAFLADLAGPEVLCEVVASLPSNQRPQEANIAGWAERQLRDLDGMALVSIVLARLMGGIARQHQPNSAEFRHARIVAHSIHRSLARLRAVAERRAVERFGAWLGSQCSLSKLSIAFAFDGRLLNSFRPRLLPETAMTAIVRMPAREAAA